MGVANTENQNADTSPDERLLWHNVQDQLDAVSPIVPRRGKKRARSSSPLSSPAVDKLRTPAINVKKLKQALKSPHTDPALDLWDRFAVDGPNSKNPLGATNPALAHLMVSSSPRPSNEGKSSHGESGLRRAISCGSHWPKRRRTEAVSDSGPVKDGRERNTKSSMVTALLETVNGEINKSDEMDVENVGLESPSVKRRRSPRKPTVLATPLELPKIPPAAMIRKTEFDLRQDTEDAKSPTSDYGDEEFDDDTLWDLDASLLSGQVEARSFTMAENTLAAGKKEQPEEEESFDDDFDDMDDDLLAAAEDLIADDTPRPKPKPAPDPAVTAVHLDGGTDDPDDMYGDDFGGDFDFDAAELAATQSVGQAESSLLPVRTI